MEYKAVIREDGVIIYSHLTRCKNTMEVRKTTCKKCGRKKHTRECVCKYLN